MKRILKRMAVLLVVGALTSVLALGKPTEKKVTFLQSLTVNGTLIKKGTYKVTFNDETGELTIKDGKKIVATAQAKLEKIDTPNSSYTHLASDDKNQPPALLSVALKDGSQATLVSGSDNKAMMRQ